LSNFSTCATNRNLIFEIFPFQLARHLIRLLLFSLAILWGLSATGQAGELSILEKLGKQIFFDTNLSTPPGQACASCHLPEAGFTGPTSAVNQQGAVYVGAVPSRSGNRKPPSVAYASFSPVFSYSKADETYVGGQFWDGRAINLVEQAKAPFLNPLEMNNKDAAEVVGKVLRSSYRPLFNQAAGPGMASQDTEAIFDFIARALAAYESSREVNSFSSKYDAYLAGRAKLTPLEQQGLDLFINKANCTACHPHDPDSDGNPPLFTDFTYDNVGAPRNPRNPYYRMSRDVNPEGEQFRDLGLGGSLQKPEEWGKVKVPTLRNIGRRPAPEFVKSYLHNGVFKSLKEVVHFYNTRDVPPGEFGDPDVVENVNREELGNLKLTDAEENALVAFLETLSDGYFDPETGNLIPGPIADSGNGTASPGKGGDVGIVNGDHFRGAAEVARYLRFRSRVLQATRPDQGATR